MAESDDKSEEFAHVLFLDRKWAVTRLNIRCRRSMTCPVATVIRVRFFDNTMSECLFVVNRGDSKNVDQSQL